MPFFNLYAYATYILSTAQDVVSRISPLQIDQRHRQQLRKQRVSAKFAIARGVGETLAD
jgi:hypothetical protein